jgi:hypothetical protein
MAPPCHSSTPPSLVGRLGEITWAVDLLSDGWDCPRVPFRVESIWSIDLVSTDRIGSRVIKSKPSMSDLAAAIAYRFSVMLL